VLFVLGIGCIDKREVPLWLLLVALGLNLLIMAKSVETVVRLKKLLTQGVGGNLSFSGT
jgi:hypothetical protein